ncbi:hypothetical protein L208DRAFT_924390 [Tricholoma matsutake]|nr:hypothetical protein L208DRAFT_924390 [Tricholoma matsutake 945]
MYTLVYISGVGRLGLSRIQPWFGKTIGESSVSSLPRTCLHQPNHIGVCICGNLHGQTVLQEEVLGMMESLTTSAPKSPQFANPSLLLRNQDFMEEMKISVCKPSSRYDRNFKI